MQRRRAHEDPFTAVVRTAGNRDTAALATGRGWCESGSVQH